MKTFNKKIGVSITGAVLLLGLNASYAAPITQAVTANIIVNSVFNFTCKGNEFKLAGNPDTEALQAKAVNCTIKTNNKKGYKIQVASTADELLGSADNKDTIPFSNVSVKNSACKGSNYTDLSTTAVTLVSKDSKTQGTGDDISMDVKTKIPFVNADTYTGTINIIAELNT